MQNKQKPLGSGYGPQTTTSDVVNGLDLTGRYFVVTGGHSGLGLATTRALAAAGADILVAARQPEAAKAANRGIDRVAVAALDLADLVSVERCADGLLAAGRPIDGLINNAGLMACPETRVGPGWEAQFATNHLGHFALTVRLWPVLARGARVVCVASAGHHIEGIRWDDMQSVNGYDKWRAYGQSKTANILFAVHLDRLGRDGGIRAFALHPGKIFTPLQRHLSRAEMVAQGWLDREGRPADPTFKTLEQGAATQVWAATAPQLDGHGGVYCEDCDIAVRAERADQPFVGVTSYATDPDAAARLWARSAELTEVDLPGLR